VAIVLFVGTHQVLSGRLSLGLLLVFVSYISSLYKPMRHLSKLAYTLSRGTASAERVAEVLNAQRDVKDVRGARPAPRLTGRVEFAGVHFAYENEPVLHDVDLTVEPREVVALVGPVGAGKSTLASLIPRFFDPSEGRVLVDDIDVRSLQLHSLRSQIALVLQEPILFEGTLFDNIAYGRPGATDKEVLEAGAIALVDEFADRLPDRYNTGIGERGVTLSGGQRQRVSIARAILRDAPVLILDEPTSALDPTSEHLLLQALDRLMRGRTTFVIAHRMSTIRGADRVVVLDRGRIVEQGSHDELIGMPGGLYRSFVELQVGTPLPELVGNGTDGAPRDGTDGSSPSRRSARRRTPAASE
jgi:ATP-binding cassette subfamily B protein